MTIQDKDIGQYHVCITDKPDRPMQGDCRCNVDHVIREAIERMLPHPRAVDAAMIAEALKSPEVQNVLGDLYGLRPRPLGP